MSPTEEDRGALREHLRAHLPTAPDGSISLIARAWAQQDLVVADQFCDGNVPAGTRTPEVARRAVATLPATVQERDEEIERDVIGLGVHGQLLTALDRLEAALG